VARRIRTSTPYIGHLEANKRRPSIVVINRLAEVLGLDRRDLFVLANPRVVDLLESNENDRRKSAWDEFRTGAQIQRAHQITAEEMKLLSMVASMGEVVSPRDFVFILNAVRHALDR
jgi:transcriptional regulator with XRE-family HTH domain